MKYLIACLGNIGIEYAGTRHNIGFDVADMLAADGKVSFVTERYAAVAVVKYKGRQLVVIKPSTYMNLSGNAVRYWLAKEGIEKENLMVVFDDKDLPTGAMRMRGKGSGGSHNGINHIIETLGTDAFPRLRIGIGNEFAKGYQVDYVLGKWTSEEKDILIPRLKVITDAVKAFTTIGIARAMNEFNNK
ncbi:MAG: aminoacyl-tRNA hydrolase [Bacteroidetes bacterium GWE2_42_24]|nr:MAG: aminoacyl-tRNA hydrolase [Bacteroidetes bacterium GWE2_42_24]OFY25441.1 MAG: aminoacyl-tRNA hydrolase [Bacteroidetes bacterium GWF2_43_11]HCT84508.1 aminoacyl-tRNA hydrolase [Candidatus Margulisiibacteriota bacterium]